MFSKKLEYSYKIIKLLKENKGKVSGIEIIEKLRIPKYYGLGVLTKLVHSGLLSSEKGKSGGFCLTKTNVSLLTLYLAVEEERNNSIVKRITEENCDKEITYDNVLKDLEKKLKLEMHKIIV